MISELLLTVLIFLLQPQIQSPSPFQEIASPLIEVAAPLSSSTEEIAKAHTSQAGKEKIEEELKKGNLPGALEVYIALQATLQREETTSTPLPDSLETALSEAKTAGTLPDILKAESEKSTTSLLQTRETFIKAVDGLNAEVVEEVEQELMLAEQILVSTNTYAEHQEYDSWIELLIKAQSHIFRAEILLAKAG